MSEDRGDKLLAFLQLVGKLKHLTRTGWVLRSVKNPETVAGHMYRMAMMTFMLEPSDTLDRRRCMEIALVHDLGESIIGDITPYCDISPLLKKKQEEEAMREIGKLLGENGDHVYNLFMEYEEQSTPEAKFVKELDLFDMSLQAFEYEERDMNCGQLEEFIEKTKGKFSHPIIKDLVNKVYKKRTTLKALCASTCYEADNFQI